RYPQAALARPRTRARQDARRTVANRHRDARAAAAVHAAGGMRHGGRALVLGVLLAGGVPVRGAAQCADGSPPPCRISRPALDSARYVILPFAQREGSQAIEPRGAQYPAFPTYASSMCAHA